MNSFGHIAMTEHRKHGGWDHPIAAGYERPLHEFIGKRLRQHYPPARTEDMPLRFRELLEALDRETGTRPRLKTSFRD